jgi:hypothetical protein
VKVGGVDIRWAHKLRPEKLRRLYELDAQGLADAELIDEVGDTLYSRCERRPKPLGRSSAAPSRSGRGYSS